jgi:hypothetical protein
MKKSKLSLEKFKIAILNNPSKIIGGTGSGDTVTNTGTADKKETVECYLTSLIEIPNNSIVKGSI